MYFNECAEMLSDIEFLDNGILISTKIIDKFTYFGLPYPNGTQQAELHIEIKRN